MAEEKRIKATCVACRKTFTTTEAYVRQVQEGREESLCPTCSGENMSKTIDKIIKEVREKMEGGGNGKGAVKG